MRKKTIISIIAFILSLIMLSVVLVSCQKVLVPREGDYVKKTVLPVNSSGNIKILQLTDLHLTSGGSYKLDKQTLKFVEYALDTAKPDIVMVTGDAVGGGNPGRNNGIIALAELFEEKQIYWSYSFGNHDGEHGKNAEGKEVWLGRDDERIYVDGDYGEGNKLFYGANYKGNLEIFNLLKGYQYCLLARSDEELNNPQQMGVGNHVIKFTNQEGKVLYAIIVMDTHGKTYIETASGEIIDQGYIGLRPDQIEWYKKQVKELSSQGIPSGIFMHVPNYGFREAFEQYIGDNRYGQPQFAERADMEYWGSLINNNTKYKDYAFVKQEGVYAPRFNDNLYDAMIEYPTSNLIAVGHDHNNSLVSMQNINNKDNPYELLLCYGRTSGVNAWARDIPIGATLYVVNPLAKNTTDMYDISIIWPEEGFKYEEKGNR